MAQKASDKWKITRRCVQILCIEKRIEGAIKMANLWLILKDATKPVDCRLLRYKKDNEAGGIK
jgi:hypothetical protein